MPSPDQVLFLQYDSNDQAGGNSNVVLTLVQAVEIVDLRAGLLPDDAVGPLSGEEADAWEPGVPYDDRVVTPATATFHQAGGWAYCWEWDGRQGLDDEIAMALSRGTRLVRVYWNIAGGTLFTVYVDGERMRSFEPVLYRDEVGGWHGERLLEESDIDWSNGALCSAMMALQHRITGVVPELFTAGPEVYAYLTPID